MEGENLAESTQISLNIMKAHLFILFFLLGINPVPYLFLPDLLAQSNIVKAVAGDLLIDGNPSSVKIGDYMGEKINACINKQGMGQDVHHLITPFIIRRKRIVGKVSS